VSTFAVQTVAERLAGRRASRARAFLLACMAGAGSGVFVYRLLRGGDLEKGG
jgi:hypothetical protein